VIYLISFPLWLAFIFPCLASREEIAIEWSKAEVGAGQRERPRTPGRIAYARRERARSSEQGRAAAALKRSQS